MIKSHQTISWIWLGAPRVSVEYNYPIFLKLFFQMHGKLHAMNSFCTIDKRNRKGKLFEMN